MNSRQPVAQEEYSAPSRDAPLRLHVNENPFGCSLLVQESLSISESLAQQPGPLSRTLLGALSRYAGRPATDLHIANSPEGLLEHVLSTVVGRDEECYAVIPHGGVLGTAAARVGVRLSPVERGPGGSISATELMGQGVKCGTAIYLGSPNDPTGEVATPLQVISLLRVGLTVVVDETYAEFSDRPLSIVGREFPNLVSLRSFAPWAGLWGIPVSYALASAEVAAELDSRWPQRTVTAASRIAAGASLDDLAILENRVKHVRLERARLYRRLRKLNFVQPAASNGPFILCQVTRGTAARVCEMLADEGVLVHHCVEEGLPNHIRISVGTSDQTDQLMTAMRHIAVEL